MPPGVRRKALTRSCSNQRAAARYRLVVLEIEPGGKLCQPLLCAGAQQPMTYVSRWSALFFCFWLRSSSSWARRWWGAPSVAVHQAVAQPCASGRPHAGLRGRLRARPAPSVAVHQAVAQPCASGRPRAGLRGRLRARPAGPAALTQDRAHDSGAVKQRAPVDRQTDGSQT